MLQKTIALSSCEAEYMAFKEAIKESIHLNNIIIYFGKLLNIQSNKIYTPKLLTNNESTLKLANNLKFHKRSKYINITYHFIKEAISNNKVELLYINTKRQLADGFTKGLNNNKHINFIKAL